MTIDIDDSPSESLFPIEETKEEILQSRLHRAEAEIDADTQNDEDNDFSKT